MESQWNVFPSKTGWDENYNKIITSTIGQSAAGKSNCKEQKKMECRSNDQSLRVIFMKKGCHFRV